MKNAHVALLMVLVLQSVVHGADKVRISIANLSGQFTDPAVHEQNVSSRKQLTVERSELDHIITGTSEAYDQAVSLLYIPKDSPWRGCVAR